MMAICSVIGCVSHAFCRGFCRKHYSRWERHGDPTVCLKPLSQKGEPLAWLRANLGCEQSDCLIWPFARFPDGRAHMAAGKPARIMCAMVHGDPPSDIHEAAHSCGAANSGCVHPKHLRWATPAENSADKRTHGTHLEGEKLPQAKLSEIDVIAIRDLSTTCTQTSIARAFGVHLSAINKIVHRKAWKHIP